MCFFIVCKVFAHNCTISLKLCVEPVVCARRSRILRALIAFSCRQQLYNNKRISFFVHGFFISFSNEMKCTAYSRAWSLSSALGDREYFVLSSPSLAVSSSFNIVYSRRKSRVFFNLCKVCLHKFVRFISKIARGACRLRSAIENTSCSHRLLLPSAALWFILSQEPVGGGIVCFGFLT